MKQHNFKIKVPKADTRIQAHVAPMGVPGQIHCDRLTVTKTFANITLASLLNPCNLVPQ